MCKEMTSKVGEELFFICVLTRKVFTHISLHNLNFSIGGVIMKTSEIKLPINRKNRSLKKPSGSIYLSCDAMSKVSRKTFNHLLHNAAPNMLTQDVHTISISDLKKRINSTSNFSFIKSVLEKMATTKVTWNFIDRDKKDTWGVATLLGDAEVTDGILSYSYTTKMRKLLSTPSVYAILDLRSQDKLALKYSVVLFEIATDWYREKDKKGETPWWSIDEFRTMMGVANSKAYDTFANLRRFVIDKSIEELNNETDFFVTYKLEKQSRTYKRIKFHITKPNEINLTITDNGNSKEIPPDLIDLIPENQRNDCKQVCMEILEKLGIEALSFYIRHTKDLDKKSKRDSWGATIRVSLKRDDFGLYKESIKKEADKRKAELDKYNEEEIKFQKKVEKEKKERAERMKKIASLTEEEAIGFEEWLVGKNKKVNDGTKIMYINDYIEVLKDKATHIEEEGGLF